MAKILLVDAAPETLHKAAATLRDQGHEVIQSNNAFSAIELCSTDAPDCIVIANDLPQMNGLEICKRLQRDEYNNSAPILIICDTRNSPEIEQLLDAGVSEFIQTPINIPLLSHRVNHLINHSLHKQQQENHEKLLREAKQTERLATIGIMATGIAHEFNNLNTIILGNVELLIRHQDLPPHASERVANIHEAVLRSKHTTNNLLNFTRGHTSPTDIVQLQEVINTTVSMARGSFVQNAIQVRTDIPPHPILVRGNADELSQVLLNMIINSMHAMDGQDEKVLSISLSVDTDEEEACISINDTGCGIPPEKIKHLFHPYYARQDDDQNALSKFAGCPMGLSISEAIIENHCGNIQVESTVDIGTSFSIALPTCTDSHYYKTPGEEQFIVPDLKNKQILIADDEAHIRELLCDLLEEQGCEVCTASNGKQAINKMQNKIFDAIILDWQMPLLDGAGVLHHIHQMPPEQQAPVIVVSGWHSTKLLNEQQQITAPVTISKPFKSDDMIDAVKEAIKADRRSKASN